MYSPLLKEELVKTLYRLKRFYQKPMTQIAEGLIKESLNSIDRKPVCRICVFEENNDCNKCYLSCIQPQENRKSLLTVKHMIQD